MTRNYLKDDVDFKYEGTFSVRVVDHWNSLPQEVIDSESVNGFKRMLDE